MTYGLDTSVVLRIITGEPQSLAEAVSARIVELQDEGNDFFISGIVVSEAYYALQYFYGNTKEDAIVALRALARESGFSVSAEAKAALETPEAWKANPGLVDRMIAGGYAMRGHITLSCEKSFHRLDLAEVVG
ncbi:MAG: PIN domain-containing protein [Kiritimatiellae bacterium]|nr:PIN domain-containing protein [Kiritimatiellia bacterium]